MNLILDTHTFLWFVAGSDNLSESAKKMILDTNNQNYLSIASLWEISIKVKLGKLQIKGTVESVIDDLTENNIEILPINFSHIVKNHELEFHHRDPFDRIIIAQAFTENMHIVGCDVMFDNYLVEPIKRLW